MNNQQIFIKLLMTSFEQHKSNVFFLTGNNYAQILTPEEYNAASAEFIDSMSQKLSNQNNKNTFSNNMTGLLQDLRDSQYPVDDACLRIESAMKSFAIFDLLETLIKTIDLSKDHAVFSEKLHEIYNICREKDDKEKFLSAVITNVREMLDALNPDRSTQDAAMQLKTQVISDGYAQSMTKIFNTLANSVRTHDVGSTTNCLEKATVNCIMFGLMNDALDSKENFVESLSLVQEIFPETIMSKIMIFITNASEKCSHDNDSHNVMTFDNIFDAVNSDTTL